MERATLRGIELSSVVQEKLTWPFEISKVLPTRGVIEVMRYF